MSMKKILALTKRNCLLFLRSKEVVFSSLLSSVILIALYFLFIARLYSDGLNESSGLALTSKQIDAAIYLQMVMGVLVINSVSLSTGMFTFTARDFESHKTEAFLLTRTTPRDLTCSYLISALIVSFLLNLLTYFVSLIIIGAVTGVWLGAGAFFEIIGGLILTTVIGCCVMQLITTIVRSSAAISVISGFLGTILGFLCGIYMPYSNMAEATEYVGSFLPFTHLTIWLKQIALGDIFSQFGLPTEIAEVVQKDAFSAGNIGLCGADIPLWGMILFSTGVAVICFAVSVCLLMKIFGNRKNPKPKKHPEKAAE